MRRTLAFALACALTVGGLAAARAQPAVATPRTIALQVDNDEFASPNRYDRWYSQSSASRRVSPPAGASSKACSRIDCEYQRS